jgi:hypothetical protein
MMLESISNQLKVFSKYCLFYIKTLQFYYYFFFQYSNIKSKCELYFISDKTPVYSIISFATFRINVTYAISCQLS